MKTDAESISRGPLVLRRGIATKKVLDQFWSVWPNKKSHTTPSVARRMPGMSLLWSLWRRHVCYFVKIKGSLLVCRIEKSDV